MPVYFEKVPEHYTGDYPSVTITYQTEFQKHIAYKAVSELDSNYVQLGVIALVRDLLAYVEAQVEMQQYADFDAIAFYDDIAEYRNRASALGILQD